MHKRLLTISIALNIFFFSALGIFIYKQGGWAYVSYKLGLNPSFTVSVYNPSSFSGFYVIRESLFNILPQSPDDIIFLGDSITEGCEWQELFHNEHIKNRGIYGDVTAGVLKRVNTTIAGKPKKIFILIGINDVIANLKPGLIIENYSRIIEHIRALSPTTQIYIQSILPVNNTLLGSDVLNDDIIKINIGLQSIASKNNLTYIDVYSRLVDKNNQFDLKYSLDGLHPNGAAYDIWKSAIEKYVN